MAVPLVALTALITPLAPFLAILNDLDPTPEDEDIKAGYPALFLFVGMLVVIALLGVSLARHLRKSEANRRAGVYPGSPPEPDERESTPPDR